MKANEFLGKFGIPVAIAGLVPIRSGILLLLEEDCGCFLVDKATLNSHNVFFGLLSIAVGAGLILLGLWQKVFRQRVADPPLAH